MGGLLWFFATVASVRLRGAERASLMDEAASAKRALLEAASMLVDELENIALGATCAAAVKDSLLLVD